MLKFKNLKLKNQKSIKILLKFENKGFIKKVFFEIKKFKINKSIKKSLHLFKLKMGIFKQKYF